MSSSITYFSTFFFLITFSIGTVTLTNFLDVRNTFFGLGGGGDLVPER